MAMRLGGRHIHFLGIGGIGTSALAAMALESGAEVSGCDIKTNPLTDQLAARGCRIHIGHDPAHLAGVELVVRSSAVPESNVEVQAALARHIPVITRARMLARMVSDRRLVAVAGAHGKTTTTWMLSKLLLEARHDPCVMVGGVVDELGGNYHLGSGSCFVVEVDESDGSLLEFRPDFSIVTNLDLDHVDHYPDLGAMQEVFRRYVARTRPGGCVIMCADSLPALGALDGWAGRLVTYGFAESADFQATRVRHEAFGSTFDVRRPHDTITDLHLNLPGRHNVQNALAAVALASVLGLDDGVLRRALSTLGGVRRRLEVKGTAGGITVLDDYGHHPTEIRALIPAARRIAAGRLIGVFQPHRYTRTAGLADRFGDCFDGLDLLVLVPIYSAGEEPIEGVSSRLIHQAVEAHGSPPCVCLDGLDAAHSFLVDHLEPGDTVLTIGAGDVYRLGERLLEDLEEREGKA